VKSLRKKDRCVVTGIGILNSIGNNKEEVLGSMKKGTTGIHKITRFETDKFMSQIGAELKNYDPNMHFSKAEQKMYDYCAQYAIISAKEAIEDSHLNLEEMKQQRIGLAFGTCNGGINSLEEQGNIKQLDQKRTARYPFYQQGDDVATFFGLNGPINTLNTACAASGNAIGFAYDMITEGYADVMLAGGSDSMSPTVYAGFNVLQALNSEPCSPYSDKLGLSLGEGAAFVVLEPLSKALKRKAFIYSEICGYGLSSDSYHETAPDPEGAGIRFAVELALKQSGVDKEQIGYINTHGTGTKANDSAELKGLENFFGEKLFSNILFSSSKAYFGHNLGAAAAIEYVTTLLAMQEGLLPATVNFETAREGCEYQNLISNNMKQASPEYFLCNNSAFGGHNASIVSKNWNKSQTSIAPIPRSNKTERVVITGMGMINGLGHIQGGAFERIFNSNAPIDECSFSLKEYDQSLYQRRMNRLSQFGIGAADLALKDANLEVTEKNQQKIGLIYGTSRGTLQSAEKYFNSIFENSPEYASGIYFPDLVVNSTAGKIGKKLQIKGYSSSLSTGGNDGLMSAFYGFEVIRKAIHDDCLVGAGDEHSELSRAIDIAYGLDDSEFPCLEGSSFLTLTSLKQAQNLGKKVYAEILGVGTTFEGSYDESSSFGIQMQKAIDQALEQAETTADEIDFIFYNSDGRPKRLKGMKEQLAQKFKNQKILCFNDQIGYGESTSSLNHLYLAAEYIHFGLKIPHYARQIAPSVEETHEGGVSRGLVVSSSVNGNNIAMVVGSVR